RERQLEQARTVLLEWGELELGRGTPHAGAEHWLQAAALLAPRNAEEAAWPVGHDQARAYLVIPGRAAEAGRSELSRSCLGPALKGGTPAVPHQPRNGRPGAASPVALTPRVLAMEPQWPTDPKSAAAVYDVLVECVLPPGQPGEVRWYVGEITG